VKLQARPRTELIASYTYGLVVDGFAMNKEDRKKAASSGAAMPDGRFPIVVCTGENSVESAVGLARTNAERKHTMTRAKSLGCSSKIPDTWNSDGSKADSGAETTSLAAPVPPAPPVATKPAEPAVPKTPTEPVAGDADMASTIAKAKEAVAAAIAAQDAEPDAKTDPNDATVMADLQSAAAALDKADKDLQVDVAAEAPAAKTPPPAKAQVAAGAQAPAPTDDATGGEVEPSTVCKTPGCGHAASVHADTPTAPNSGACQTPGCTCTKMVSPAQTDDQDDDQGDTKLATSLALPGGPPVESATLPKGATVEDNPPPEVAGSENMGPAFTIPVGVVEGQPTGDGRQIAPNALTWRTPPMPLMLLKTSAHDPTGYSPNDPAVICGRIDSLERVPGENGTQIITAKGFYLATEDGMEAAAMTEQLGRMGISADIAGQAEEQEVTDVGEDGWPTDMTATLTEGVIMGFTQLPFPAFAAAYIVLGDGADAMAAIPQQTDDPDQHLASGQILHLMTFEECSACDAGIEVITASAGPVAPPAEWFAAPEFEEGDGRLQEIYSKRGRREGQFACPLTVMDDGRIFGHIAPWGVCHASFPGACITPPRSAVDYAHFKTGEVVTAEGERLRVGTLTADTDHASIKLGAADTVSHYDNTGTIAAFVNAGEDDYGIWVAGALAPDVTDGQIARIRSAGVSGDWRKLGGRLELVAALCVPTPGYGLAFVEHGEKSLVAAGAAVMYSLGHPEAATLTGEGDVVLRAALAPLVAQSGKLARGRINAATAQRARERIGA
jgi:hypothetical protein